LATSFPEYQWTNASEQFNVSPKLRQQREKRKPHGYWLNIDNQRKFFDEAAITLSIRQPTDWYDVSLTQLLRLGVTFVRDYYGGSVIEGMNITVIYNRSYFC
jgi:hypothetical protein